jgi:hypothetical protein
MNEAEEGSHCLNEDCPGSYKLYVESCTCGATAAPCNGCMDAKLKCFWCNEVVEFGEK